MPAGDPHALTVAISEALDADHDPEALMRRAAEFSPINTASRYLELLFPDG